MKILALMCSHRRKKNTAHSLKCFLEGFGKENEIVVKNLIDLNLKMCIACDYCERNYGKCVLNDDVDDLISDMLECDLLVIATPVYFNSVTTILKTLIDRTQVLYNAWYNFKDPIFKQQKPVVIIALGGSRSYKTQFKGIDAETEHFLANIKGEIIDFIKYSDTDRTSLIDNTAIYEELIEKGREVEAKLNQL